MYVKKCKNVTILLIWHFFRFGTFFLYECLTFLKLFFPLFFYYIFMAYLVANEIHLYMKHLQMNTTDIEFIFE